jgi:RNA polymerase sigma factor (sigma-70 family)
MRDDDRLSGRKAAFLRLQSENEAPLIRYAARLLRDTPSIPRSHSAEEIVEDVLGSLSVREDFDPERPEAIYYVRVSINNYISNLKRSSKRSKVESLDYPSSLGASMGVDGPLSSVLIDPNAVDPACVLSRNEMIQVVFDRLLPHHRRALVLYHIEEVGGYKEVAEIMNITPDCVDGLLRRAREKFKEAFVGLYGGDGNFE